MCREGLAYENLHKKARYLLERKYFLEKKILMLFNNNWRDDRQKQSRFDTNLSRQNKFRLFTLFVEILIAYQSTS